MVAKTVTFDRLIVSPITLTRDGSAPVVAAVTYELSTSEGQYPSSVTFTPVIPGGMQTTLNNMWDMAVNAAMQREGLA